MQKLPGVKELELSHTINKCSFWFCLENNKNILSISTKVAELKQVPRFQALFAAGLSFLKTTSAPSLHKLRHTFFGSRETEAETPETTL